MKVSLKKRQLPDNSTGRWPAGEAAFALYGFTEVSQVELTPRDGADHLTAEAGDLGQARTYSYETGTGLDRSREEPLGDITAMALEVMPIALSHIGTTGLEAAPGVWLIWHQTMLPRRGSPSLVDQNAEAEPRSAPHIRGPPNSSSTNPPR